MVLSLRLVGLHVDITKGMDHKKQGEHTIHSEPIIEGLWVSHRLLIYLLYDCCSLSSLWKCKEPKSHVVFFISLIINTFIQQSMVAPSPEGISSLVLVRLPLFFILPVSEVQGFYKITWSGIWVVVCTLWSGPLDIWHQPTFPVFVEHAAEVWSFGALLWSRAWLNKDRHKPNIAKHLKHNLPTLCPGKQIHHHTVLEKRNVNAFVSSVWSSRSSSSGLPSDPQNSSRSSLLWF